MDRSLPQLTNLTEQVEKQKLSAETLIKEKEQEIRDLKGTVSQQSQESTGLKAEVEGKTRENEKLKQEIEKLKEEITEKRGEVKDKTQENDKHKKENEELKEKITEKKGEINNQHKLNILAVGLFVLCAVLVFQLPLPFSYLKFQQISEPNKLTRQTVDAFRSQLNIWKQQFPNQNQVFWTYVQARSKSHLITDVPSRPLVFAIAASKKTSELSRCFGKKLGHVLSANARQVESINASDYETRNDQEAEEELGETIKSHLSTAPAGAVVIDHLELLPSKMAFIFFSYCDNEDAPFPYASFIFIVHGKETSLESMEPLEAEEKVKSFLLDEVWSTDTHGPSAVAALVSRVADVIIVPSEDSTVNC